MVNARTVGPAPETVAAIPAARSSCDPFARERQRRGALRLVQPILGRRHQQIGAIGQRDHRQRRPADVERRVAVGDLLGQQPPGVRRRRALLGDQPHRARMPTPGCSRSAPVGAGARGIGLGPRHHGGTEHAGRGVVGMAFELRGSWTSRSSSAQLGVELARQPVGGRQSADHGRRRGAQATRVRNRVAAHHDQTVGPHTRRFQSTLDRPHHQMRRIPRHLIGAFALDPDVRPDSVVSPTISS